MYYTCVYYVLMCIHAVHSCTLLFSDGGVFSNQCQHTFPPACQHLRKAGAQFQILRTASLILRTFPNEHIQLLRAEQFQFIGVELF